MFQSASEEAFLLEKTRAWRVLLSPHLFLFKFTFLRLFHPPSSISSSCKPTLLKFTVYSYSTLLLFRHFSLSFRLFLLSPFFSFSQSFRGTCIYIPLPLVSLFFFINLFNKLVNEAYSNCQFSLLPVWYSSFTFQFPLIFSFFLLFHSFSEFPWYVYLHCYSCYLCLSFHLFIT